MYVICLFIYFFLFRYAVISVSEQTPTPFCTDRQKNDILERSGKKIKMKSNTLLPCEDEPYVDLFKERIKYLQVDRKEKVKLNIKKYNEKLFIDDMNSIPIVNYNPNTALQLLRSSDGNKLYNNAINNYDEKLIDFNTLNINQKHSVEQEYINALHSTKNGNRRALYEHFIDNKEKI